MTHKSDWTGGLTKDELGLSAETTTAQACAEQQQQQGGQAALAGNKALTAPVWLEDPDDAGDDPRVLPLELLERQTHMS